MTNIFNVVVRNVQKVQDVINYDNMLLGKMYIV